MRSIWPHSARNRASNWLVMATVVFSASGLGVWKIGGPRAIAQVANSVTGDVGSPSKSTETPGATTCQVTVVGILVTTDEKTGVDPKLSNIKNQLRKLFPNHGFKLLDVRSEQLAAKSQLSCGLGKGKTARVTLLDSLDADGKIRLRCELIEGEKTLVTTNVATPPNQLFFHDRKQPDGTRLLIAIGAR